MLNNNYINDLNLRDEIFPLFDNCLNDLSKNKLYNLLSMTLVNVDEIYHRQFIIKGGYPPEFSSVS